MTPSLWFVMPVHGRTQLARICMTQLRRTCDQLTDAGINATAVVIGNDANLHTARSLGFGTVERDNTFLSRKFNDGIQLACDKRHNPHPADFVVPIGSDDWVDHKIFLDLPSPRTMVGFPRLSVVREDGREIVSRVITSPGGSGIRIYPRQLLEPLNFRPADEDRKRACDTSILTNVSRYWTGQMRIMHHTHPDHSIVDWKSPNEQMNAYADLGIYKAAVTADPFDALAGLYPAEALEQMQAHYARELVAA